MDLLAAARWLALGGWLFWLATYWRGGWLIVQDIRAARSRLDRALLVAIALLGAALALTGLAMTLGAVEPLPPAKSVPVALLGAALVFAGMAGTFYCRSYLGRFWTAEAALQADHQIIDAGPYAVVRHPIYTAALTMYLGAAVIFATWWTVLAFVLLVGAHALKVRGEERLLAAHLPAYHTYQRRVRFRLVPCLW